MFFIEPITLGQILRSLSMDGSGFGLGLALALTLSASLLQIVIAGLLLRRFRAIGPVRTEAIHDFIVDWDRRELPYLVARWLGALGVFLAVAMLILGAANTAVDVLRLGGAPTRYGAWRLPLAEDLVGINVALWVVVITFGMRFVLGGVAGFIHRRAAWYVRAGEALPGAAQLARLNALTASLDDAGDSEP